jgi:PAS domain S-box-containing protein
MHVTDPKPAHLSPELVLENFPEGILLLDADGFISFVNAAVRRITQFDPSDLVGKPFHVLFGGPEEGIRVSYELSQAKKTGSFRNFGWKKNAGGGTFWCEMVVAPLFQNHELGGYSVMISDATEQKDRELELRASEERFRLMVQGVKDYSIFMLDPTGIILTWNEGAKRTVGYSANEIIGKHFSIFYTAEDLAVKKPQRELEIAAAEGRYEEEGWRIRKSGSLFWSSVVITALRDDRGQLIGYSKVTRDLTERREKEDMLKQSEERYRLLVEQVTDYGIFMMDEKGFIISWNEGARRIKGYSAEEIIGQRFTKFYTEEDLLNGKPEYELKVAAEVGKYEEEGWRLRKDGSRFWANVVITAVYNATGVLIGFSKVTRDLTERKESERALRESYDKYRQLTEQLRRTNADLSYTNHELEQFTSIVSHDLQEPIRTIKSFLLLIENRLSSHLPQEGHTYIRKSISASSRMQELIKNLLSYSQLSKHEMVQEPVSVEHIIQETMANLRSAIESRQAVVQIDVKVPYVFGDSIQLVQLLQNIIGNSLKFTDKEQPEINIRCYEASGMATFAISDNGIGIDTEDLHKVFDIFRRLHTVQEYPGTGIGLAICKKIVDRHGGQIWLESEKGRGTTFYFTLHIA